MLKILKILQRIACQEKTRIRLNQPVLPAVGGFLDNVGIPSKFTGKADSPPVFTPHQIYPGAFRHIRVPHPTSLPRKGVSGVLQ